MVVNDNKDDVSNTPQSNSDKASKAEMNRIRVFKFIEKTQPTTIYKISRDLEMAYNTVSYIVRDLIFAGVVLGRIQINENNVATKVLTIPKEKKER